MDLFDSVEQDDFKPLAERLRPKALQDLVGQDFVLNQNPWLKESLADDNISSLILWGPPGTGKTTFARIIANSTKKQFVALHAIATGAKEIRDVCESARQKKRMYQQGTILFIDEIHRLNRAQQDVFLPYVENGDIVLIGATTENPSFEINSALLSRCRVLTLIRHTDESLLQILNRALNTFGQSSQELFHDEARKWFLAIADGDARKLLNRLEEVLRVYHAAPKDFPLSQERLSQILGSQNIYHDKAGELHYNTISAFIKSIRGSDPDAGLYYLARLLEGGEDPRFIARRLLILASEDIGNADPRALQVALSGFQAVDVIGLPECAIHLGQVVVYLSCAPKSNASYMGIKKAQEEVRQSGLLDIPKHICNAPTTFMKDQGYANGYSYSHDGERGWQEQSYMPEKIKNKKFYKSKFIGYEKKMEEFLQWMKNQK